jgi:hypothetical protein
MSPSKNGQHSLSAGDFLQLTEFKRIARVDLAEVGMDGIVYVCDLSTAQQQKLYGGSKSMRVYKDDSRDVALPKDAAAKIIQECMITDKEDGQYLESEFDKTDEEFVTVPLDQIVYYRDLWKEQLGNTKAVNDKIQNLPNIVTNLIVKNVSDLSGLAGDEVEEKKST